MIMWTYHGVDLGPLEEDEAAEDDQDDVGEGFLEEEGREKHDDSSLIDRPPKGLHQ